MLAERCRSGLLLCVVVVLENGHFCREMSPTLVFKGSILDGTVHSPMLAVVTESQQLECSLEDRLRIDRCNKLLDPAADLIADWTNGTREPLDAPLA